MISEFFITLLYNFVHGLFALLPDMTFSVNTSAFSFFLGIVKIAGYLLPWSTVGAIVAIIIALNIFKILISFIKTIWDLLPIV